MTNIEARKQARFDIVKSLKSAGLIDGNSIAAEKLATTTTPIFHRGVVKNDAAKVKDSYVSWKVVGSRTAARADNSAFLREVTIALDVFSKRSFESEQNHKLLERLENQFELDGYEIELADERYESDTGLYHYPLTLFKLY